MSNPTTHRPIRRIAVSTIALFVLVLFSNPVRVHCFGEIPELKGLDGIPGFGAANSSAPKLTLRARWYAAAESHTGWLEIEAKLPKNWDHIYAIEQPAGGPKGVKIAVDGTSAAQLLGPFLPEPAAEIIDSGIFPVPEYEHTGTVTWRAPIRLDPGADPASILIQGSLTGQICREGECADLEADDHKFIARFDTDLQGPAIAAEASGSASNGGSSSVPSKGNRASSDASTDQQVPDATNAASTVTGVVSSIRPTSLLQAIAIGLVGGLVLNLMPCVLPVIGLKILSFVQQSHGDRRQAFILNVVYALGILVVMMALAALSVRFNLSWGEQFGIPAFKVAMIVLVFAMALSFLGVWEIPLPGFLGGSTAAGLAAKEGIVGAFSKGVFATLLATPCSGPLLGPLFGFTLNRPPYVTYTIFAAVALGMALPYLWIGAFPSLARWIPKPGAWMQTFKEFMAFPLLATVVYLFTALGRPELYAPTLALCFAVWFACWWIGRTPLTAPFSSHAVAWLGGVGAAVLVGYLSFATGPEKPHIAWKPFSPEALTAAQEQGKTVLVDFTANWCATCLLNSANAIDTKKVARLIDELDVVPLLADWTDTTSPQGRMIKKFLNSHGANAIPFLVIYSGANPDQKIVLPDLLSESQVLAALEAAGPSRTTNTASKKTSSALDESL